MNTQSMTVSEYKQFVKREMIRNNKQSDGIFMMTVEALESIMNTVEQKARREMADEKNGGK